MEQTIEKVNKIIPEPNKNQKECIYNTLTGKYLVLAGPGTGKTFTVTRKIKYMIEQQKVDPSKILCLTFSNTASREMKTKICSNIEGDYELDIFTYHEFCLNIIEEHPEAFNISNLKVITDSVKRNLIKECIDKINPKAYNNEKNNPYQYTKDILDGIEEIKKNRLNKEQFFNNLEENPAWKKHLDELIKLQNDKKTKTRADEIKALSKKIAQMEELWEFYELYNKKMKDTDYIDFHDMINAVLEKFEDKESSLIEEIAKKYEYILVDEYQDTNKAQNDIVFNLAKYCKNVFVVGDDDQIIYTFQGANLNTIENYLNNFPDVKVICLTENNRSTQNILDVSQNLAELQNDFCKFMAYKARSKKEKEFYESNQIDLRICSKEKFKSLNIVKSLISPKTSPVYDKKKAVEYYGFDNIQDERDYIVATIKNLVNSPDCPEKLSEIAILTRSNDEIKTFETYLKANNIPTEITGGKNIFDITAVNVFITYLQFLVNPELYSDKLLSYLLSKPFHIDARDYKTLCNFKSHHRTLLDNINNLIEKGIDESSLKSKLKELLKADSNTLTDDIKELLNNKNHTLYDREKLTDFIETYNYLKDYTVSEFYTNSLLEIGSKTGLFDFYLNQDINKLENIKGIKKLLDEADSFFATHKNTEDTFSMFVEYLTTMIDSGIKILLDKEEKPLNAIQLTTYHSSKGREFEYVFMPTLTSNKWESSQGNSDKIPLPSNGLTYDEIQEQQNQNKFLDNIKLLYVGMTRAKHTLVLSGIENGTRTGKLSWFISKILDNLKDRSDLILSPEKTEVKGLSDIKPDYDYKKQFEEFIKSRFQKSYSPSSLNTYRRCPRAYFYNYILNIKSDSGNKDNLAYGLAVHKAFQYIIEYTMENKKYPTKDESYNVFEKAIDRIPCQYPDKLKLSGKEQIFDKYFDKFTGIISANNLDSKAELALNYTIDGINFNGSIDRIDKNTDGTYSIYDYKTGTDESGITKSGVHSDYYYQIAFYKYLFKKQFNINKNVSTCFLYPLIEEPHVYKDISDDECEEIAKEYIELVKNIEDMEFEKPAKCPNERFCNYKCFCKVNAI